MRRRLHWYCRVFDASAFVLLAGAVFGACNSPPIDPDGGGVGTISDGAVEHLVVDATRDTAAADVQDATISDAATTDSSDATDAADARSTDAQTNVSEAASDAIAEDARADAGLAHDADASFDSDGAAEAGSTPDGGPRPPPACMPPCIWNAYTRCIPPVKTCSHYRSAGFDSYWGGQDITWDSESPVTWKYDFEGAYHSHTMTITANGSVCFKQQLSWGSVGALSMGGTYTSGDGTVIARVFWDGAKYQFSCGSQAFPVAADSGTLYAYSPAECTAAPNECPSNQFLGECALAANRCGTTTESTAPPP